MKKHFIFVIITAVIGVGAFMRFNAHHVRAQNTRIVTVHLDGEARTIATDAGTVREVLERLQADLATQDKTEPALDSAVKGGDFTINVYRARPISVVDGANSYTVMTAERSPKEIAASVGFKTNQEDRFAFKRSDDLVESVPGTQMVIKRAKVITFDLYGTASTLRTHENTVGDLLKEKAITLEAGDQVNMPLEAKINEGATISIARFSKNVTTVEEPVAFPEEKINDVNQPTSYRQVKIPGQNGKKLVTYETVTKNGQAAEKKAIKEVVTQQPVKQIVVVGAKSNQFSGDFAGALARLRSCEGAYTSNTGNGYYGAYQFDRGTWANHGGYAVASDAPPAVQDEKAWLTYKRRGWSPWPSCSRKLGLQDIYR